MTKAKILLQSISDVKEFVTAISMCDFDADLISGRYTVDAKSIMGIFSLDLSNPIDIIAYTDDSQALFAQISKFIVK